MIGDENEGRQSHSQQARKMARLELAFQSEEANAAHEFGDDYDPGNEYRELRRQIIAAELTFEEAEAIDLARIRSRTGQANT